jgi:transformation/transcription domain-associated protein
MIRTMDDSGDLWRMRKQFTLQLASLSFMTYVLCLSSRSPSRFHMSRATGLIAMTELLPGKDSSQAEPGVFKIMIRCLESTPHLRHK